MAAWAAFGKIDSLFWMINSAFGIAATTFVGQNFGAGKMDRVRKGTRECLGMALVTAILLSVILMSAGRFLFGIFTTDANVVEIGLSMMQIISPTYFLFVFIEVYSGALRAGACDRDDGNDDDRYLCAACRMGHLDRTGWHTLTDRGMLPNYMAGQRGGDDHLLSL